LNSINGPGFGKNPRLSSIVLFHFLRYATLIAVHFTSLVLHVCFEKSFSLLEFVTKVLSDKWTSCHVQECKLAFLWLLHYVLYCSSLFYAILL